MGMLRKTLFAIVTVVFFLGSLVSIGIADKEEHQSWGKPFRQLWNMIKKLEMRIFALENEPPVAAVKVYDAKEQYLGIYHGLETGCADIYLPSSEISTLIYFETGDVHTGSPLYFESDDCSGVPYTLPRAVYYILKIGDRYYRGERTAPLDTYVKSTFLTICSKYAPGNTMKLVPVQETNLPFIVPVSLPLELVQ
jgi:hypothetical protein